MQLACMFPGQGSQSLGMLNSIYEADDIISETFIEAGDVLGVDYWQMICKGPESLLNETQNTQLIMLISDVALYRFLRKHGMPEPQMMAGHSLGEYAALVASSAIDFHDALLLVRERAQLMQQAVINQSGAMAAIIGLDNAAVEKVCAEISAKHLDKCLSPANYNANGQVVIAGHHQLVLEAITQCESLHARIAKLIPVSVPCHCDLMKPAYEAFYHTLQNTKMRLPCIPVISNVNVARYDDIKQMKLLLAEQLYKPVRWTETLAYFATHKMDTLMECGPGKVLSGLAKRTVPEMKTLFCFESQHQPQWELHHVS